jgi:hypothetical protein
MPNDIDIKENDIRDKYPEVLEILLRDHSTQKNIFWATSNYEVLGDEYKFNAPILSELITGRNGEVIYAIRRLQNRQYTQTQRHNLHH